MKKTTQKQEIMKELERLSASENLVFSPELSDFNLNKIYSNYKQCVNVRLNDNETTALNKTNKIVLVRECILTFEIVKTENSVSVKCLNDFSVFTPKEKEISKRRQLEEENATLREMIKMLQSQVKA